MSSAQERRPCGGTDHGGDAPGGGTAGRTLTRSTPAGATTAQQQQQQGEQQEALPSRAGSSRQQGGTDAATNEEVVDPRLRPLLPDNIFFIPAQRVSFVMKEMGYTSPLELLREILKLAARCARPPISRFYVGAVGLSRAGHIYCGVNVEFDGLSLNDAIHGEQCLIARLVNADEEGIVCFCVNAPPCGHCRQFLNELDAEQLEIHIQHRGTFSLHRDLLPFSFGPNDLHNATRLLRHTPYRLVLADPPAGEQDDLDRREGHRHLIELAVAAASRAYAPYTECPSGVALRLRDGSMYRGSYIENAAYNPSLPPLQSALTGLVGDEKTWDQIEICLLIEKKGAASISQEGVTRRLLSAIAPRATLYVRTIATCVKQI